MDHVNTADFIARTPDVLLIAFVALAAALAIGGLYVLIRS
jgi:hypothetical protein